LFSKPEWVEIIKQGKEDVSKGIKGKGLMSWKIEVKPNAEKQYLSHE
jgi:hypothetical protein